MPSSAPVAMPQLLRPAEQVIPEYSLQQFAAMVANPSMFTPDQPQLNSGVMPPQMDGTVLAAGSAVAAAVGYQQSQSFTDGVQAEMGDTFDNTFTKSSFNFDFSNIKRT